MDIKSMIISFIISALTGWGTAKLSYNLEIKNKVYNERNQLYIELFVFFEKLQQSPQLMYNAESFIVPLRKLRAKTILYASSGVLEIIMPFYNKIMVLWEKYNNLFNLECAEKEIQSRYEFEIETKNITREYIEWEFWQQEEAYIGNNLIDPDEIINFMYSLATKIRAELKTK